MRRLPTLVMAAAVGLSSTVTACGGHGSSTLGGTALNQPGEVTKAPALGGRPLPDLGFTSFDGRTVRFTDLRGTPAVVNIWSETCEPCKQEMPEFEAIHRAVRPRIRFVGINSLDSERKAREFATKTGVTYELWRDQTGEVFNALKLVGLPTTLLVNAEGQIVWAKHQRLTGDELTKRLNEFFPA